MPSRDYYVDEATRNTTEPQYRQFMTDFITVVAGDMANKTRIDSVVDQVGYRLELCYYLGMLIDDGLNWDPHIKQLSLQLSKSSAIIYRLRNFVDTETFKLLYYSLIYSHIQYGIILWGTATYTRQKEIVLRLNNIVWIMTWSRKFDHVSILYKQLKLLKLEDIYKLEL